MNALILEFKTKSDLLASVEQAELAYDRQIIDVAEAIAADKNVRILSLAGPTCSGKTTTASRLTDELTVRGRHTVALSIDDFYHDREKLHNMGDEPDYESFAAIDSDYLSECVSRLLDGKNAMIPRYDFATGCRTGYIKCIPGEDNVYIFEGIQALYPQVMNLFGSSAKSIFISVTDDVVINGVYFDKTELRLVRRLLRDYYNRASSADFTLSLWKNVRLNEEHNILPYAAGCDFHIGSYLTYETPIIARALMDILSEVPEDSINSPLASHLQSKLSLLLAVSSDTDIVPEGSILREFTEKVK